MSHKCQTCGKAFRKTDHLRQHEKAAHPPQQRKRYEAFSRLPIMRPDFLTLSAPMSISDDLLEGLLAPRTFRWPPSPSSHPMSTTMTEADTTIPLPGGWSLRAIYSQPLHFALFRPDGEKQTHGFTDAGARAFAAAIAPVSADLAAAAKHNGLTLEDDGRLLRAWMKKAGCTPSMMQADRDIWKDRAEAALAAIQDQVDRGVNCSGTVRLVPVDPTDAMLDAAAKVNFDNENERGAACDLWHTMVAAAPAPAATPSSPAAVAVEELKHARGCFDAAEAEGLSQVLAETGDERLKDLVERRLLHAVSHIEAGQAAIRALAIPQVKEESLTDLADAYDAGYHEGEAHGRREAKAEIDRLTELADKFKWQVIDTCKRAEKAEAQIAAPQNHGAARDNALEDAARIADGFTCGACGMDGKAGKAIRALKTTAATDKPGREGEGLEPFPQPRWKPGEEPCGECHIQPGETCDICGASRPARPTLTQVVTDRQAGISEHDVNEPGNPWAKPSPAPQQDDEQEDGRHG